MGSNPTLSAKFYFSGPFLISRDNSVPTNLKSHHLNSQLIIFKNCADMCIGVTHQCAQSTRWNANSDPMCRMECDDEGFLS